MPINQLIAQGVRPIGSDLPQIAGMNMQAQELKRSHTREQLGLAFFVAAKDPDYRRGKELMAEIGLDPSIVDQADEGSVREMYAELGKGLAGVGGQQSPGPLYQVAGEDGNPTYQPANRAIGQPAYRAPQSPGQLYQTVGPDGGPIYQPAAQAVGQPAYRAPNHGNQAPSGYRWGANGSLEAIPGGPSDPTGPNSRKGSQPLRKEFRALPSVRDYETSLPILKSAEKAPDNGYGDLQLIYTVGKLLDPNSVVREGELALTIAAGSPLQRIIGTTRFTTERGGRLTPQSRQQIMGMLQERIGAYKQAYERDFQQYSEYASEQGYDPSLIVGKHADSAYGGAKQSGPKPGQVIDGYKFKGGDPSKQENWVKQ